MKLGDIGEEMVATAIALAKDRGAAIDAITVVRVPRQYQLEGDLPEAVAARVDASLDEVHALGADYGVEVPAEIVRARSIGHAIVAEATRRGSDLIILGSVARLAPPVAVLLADRRVRPPARAVRGAGHCLPRRVFDE